MTTKYYAILTTTGAALLANATALGRQLSITQMALGDGGGALPTPDPAQTKLVNERRRAPLNSLSIDPANPGQIIAEQVIPEDEGGWWIREIGLYDATGNLIAVANCPETYKPQLQEGSGRVQTVRMILIVSSTDAVTLKIDPSVVLATRKYVDTNALEVTTHADNLMETHLADTNPHKQYAPIESPALTGTPTAPTAAAGDHSTQLATTEFVKNNAVPIYGSLSATDLNGLTGSLAGRYWQGSSLGASLALHYPITEAGSLDVEKNTANSTEGCTQRYTTYGLGNRPRMFIRSYNPATLIWGEWQELASLSSPAFTGRVKVTADGAGAVLVKAASANADVGMTLQASDGSQIAQLTYAAAGANAQFYSYRGGNSLALMDDGSISIKPKSGQSLSINAPVVVTGDGNQINLQQKTAAPTSGSYIRAINSDGAFLWIVGRSESNGWLELGGKGSNRIALADSGDITIAPGTGKTTKITSTVTLTAPAAGDNSSAAITSGWFAAEIAGIPLPWPQATAPTGWLKCNGQSFDKTTYPKLAAAYPSGTLPDLRGEFIRGWDDGRGVDSGRTIASKQSATALRTGAMDYNGSDTDSTSVYIGVGYADADSLMSTIGFTDQRYPNGALMAGGAGKDNGVSGTASNTVFSGGVNWITVRPRNVAFNYIVRAA
ncbi:phage tail protein [Musicola keenii]|uniref:phage tail-collar fiber domain-containing protein n=1 Tax=Musicola keenii TaxID=2884250 RepID=UPI00177BB1CF|nr:phage tail protein [Musicola keenii]